MGLDLQDLLHVYAGNLSGSPSWAGAWTLSLPNFCESIEARRSGWAWQKKLKFRLVIQCPPSSLTKCRIHFSMVLEYRWATCSLEHIVYIFSLLEGLLETLLLSLLIRLLMSSASFWGRPFCWVDMAVRRVKGRYGRNWLLLCISF